MPVTLNRVGTEVLVNTETSGNQASSNVAALPGGGFVIVWADNSGTGGDASPSGVNAQIFDADGQKVGTEFLVNTGTLGAQSDPRVATLPSGQFVVTWVDFSGESGNVLDGSESAIRAQLFEADGDKVGPELLVNTTAPGIQTHIAVTELAGGGFAITWDDFGPDAAPDLNVRGQVYDSTGQRVGGEILVNTTVAGSQLQPSMIPLANGGFVVAWLGAATGIGGTSTIFQTFDAQGHKVGAEQAFASGANTQRNTSMAALDSGFVIAYGSNNGDADGQSIEVQRYDSNGNRVGGEILANLLVAGNQQAPHVDALPGGGFVVFWRGPGNPDGTTDIRARLFDSSGNPEGGEFVVNAITPGEQDLPRAALLETGQLAVTWTDSSGLGGDASPSAIKLQLFQPVQSGTSGDDVLRGGPGPDFIDGLGGNDFIDGRGSADHLVGGTGNDVFFVDDAADEIVEAAGEGRDKVYADLSFTLADNVEDLTLQPVAGAASGTGNGLANLIFGNAFANTLSGLDGDDTLGGNGGDDVLDGGLGADQMFGGVGDDTYVVDDSGDRAIETSASGGIDTVQATISFTLGDNIENLQLIGSGAVNGTGNALANTIDGSATSNRLDGGVGADTLRGGNGSDTYVVDNAGDQVIEAAGLAAGNDEVESSVNYTLAANVERLTLTGSAVSGTGNALDNRIDGNAGNNIIDGRTGADRMVGGLGNDVYFVDNNGDNVEEVADGGRDKVYTTRSMVIPFGVEDLTLLASAGSASVSGNTLNNVITGNDFNNRINDGIGNDTLIGNGGDDTLEAGPGRDIMSGGAGADQFWITGTLGPDNVDRILDFEVTVDEMVLENSFFPGLPAGPLAPSAFVIGPAALDADDRIIYNPTTGALFFDSDGSGAAAAVQFATMQAGLLLTSNDFTVV